MQSMWLTASLWMALACIASLVSVRMGIAAALVEILIGVAAGNLFHIAPTDWINTLASMGSVVLTFLAGAEIDPGALRRHFRVSVTIGTASFLAPFLGAMAYAYYIAGWSLDAAKMAGIALSTTSVAVVYAVMIETGLNQTDLGKAILAACFVTDLGTVLALGLLFSGFNHWMAPFVLATAAAVAALPRLTRWVASRRGGRTQALDLKFLMLILFILGGLAELAQSEAVLPAYLAGLGVAGAFQQFPRIPEQIRTLSITLLTPLYFLKAGLYVLLPAVWTQLGLIVMFFLVKMAAKVIGVRPLAAAFGYSAREANYTTALMATGLTFGTISSLYGLSHHLISQTQYTVLVTVVILSALLPTLIAQLWFRPEMAPTRPLQG
jgi:Kef-type K+ transport system membrane component KefB